MLTLSIERGKDNPFQTDVIQSLLRSAILGLCGAMKQMFSSAVINHDIRTSDVHFQRFLNLLHSIEVKHRTVEDYANDLFISPKYLTAICKKNSGKTASEWVTEHVLEDIRYYLRHTDQHQADLRPPGLPQSIVLRQVREGPFRHDSSAIPSKVIRCAFEVGESERNITYDVLRDIHWRAQEY